MKTIRSRRLPLALAAVALIAASGCGGSKGGVSRAELIAKADPICRRANTVVDSAKFNLHNVGQAAPGIIAAERQASAELAKLTPPSSMAADWKVIVDGFRKTSAGMQKVSEAARSAGSNEKALTQSKVFSEGASEFARGQHIRELTAARNGFADCAKF